MRPITRPVSAILAGLVVLASGCAVTAPAPRPSALEPAVPGLPVATEALQSEEARAQFHVMAGEMAAGRRQPQRAAREFLAALTIIDDPELARRATALALSARDEGLALAAAQRWLALQPNEADPREVITGIHLRRGELAETLEHCLEIVRGHPAGHGDGLRHAAQLLAQVGNDRADGALSVMHQLLAQWPDLAAAHHALGVLALRFDRLDLAEGAARHALSLEPENREHALLLVGVQVRQNRIDETDARIDQLAGSDAKAADLRMGYARLLLEAGQREAARRQLEWVVRIDKRYPDAHYALGVMAFNDSEYAAAQRHFERLLDGPRSQEAHLQLGRIAEGQQRFSQALDHYRQVSRGPASLEAATRSAFVLARLQRLDEARALLKDLREHHPQLATRLYLSEGELLINSRRFEDARALYDAALREDEDEDNADLLYGRSLAHERLNDIARAEEDLRRILATEADDARALNALGYMLAVHTNRLDEAQTLIGRAIELEPDDAAIMDSMGWLQFKLGHTETALAWLQRAYAKFPDPEVAAHLGEVLWSLGRQDEARAIWNAARGPNPDHAVLQETMQRLDP